MKKIICLLVVLSPLALFAQVTLSYNQGYGFYAMRDLKKLQTNMITGSPVNMFTNMSFPAYWYYELSSQYTIMDDFLVGSSLCYGSTAARSSYSDYSGNIIIDQRLVFFSVSISIGKSITLDNDKTRITADLKPTVILTDLGMDFSQTIGQQNEQDSYEFNSTNFALQPTISVIHPLGKFEFQASVGFHANVLSGKLKYDQNTDAYLQDDKQEPIYANWSGLRLSVGIGYLIGKR